MLIIPRFISHLTALFLKVQTQGYKESSRPKKPKLKESKPAPPHKITAKPVQKEDRKKKF